MKRKGKLLSCCLASTLLFSAIPMYVSAESNYGKVRVTVENHTLSMENGAAWEGVLLDEWVELGADSDGISVLVDALNHHSMTQQGAESAYITEINGLSAEDGGSMGGWMVTLDNWITDEMISAYTVSSGKLENGDELRFIYSCAWGADIGYDWSGTDTSLSAITFSDGELTPSFTPDNRSYTLTLEENTDAVTVSPAAVNLAYRVKTYKNTYTPAEAGTDFKLSESIPVSDGDVIIIGVANEAWMSYVPDGVSESVYQITINQPAAQVDTDVQQTESLIAAIGEVNTSGKPLIERARAAYDALSEEQQSQVSNYDILLRAESDYAALTAGSDDSVPTVSELRTAYAASVPAVLGFGSEWDMITLARFGLVTDTLKNGYVKSVKETLDTIGSSKLSSTRSTTNAGVVAALTALGADASDFYGYDLTEPLGDIEYVTKQGINGAVYALIALDCGKYQLKNSPEIRQKLISAILAAQQTDNGWTIDPESTSDADVTAMAVTALAPYYTSDQTVKDAVDKALVFLSDNQNDDGQFASYGSYDSESCAQVLIALTSLGIDPYEDPRFIKNGHNAYDGLMRFYHADNNGFAHLTNGDSNAISTYQAYLAVCALYRYENHLTAFYNMDDTSLEVYSSAAREPDNSSKPDSSETAGQASAPVSEKSDTADQTQQSSVSEAGASENNTVNTGENSFAVAFLMMSVLSACAAVLALRRTKEQ